MPLLVSSIEAGTMSAGYKLAKAIKLEDPDVLDTL